MESENLQSWIMKNNKIRDRQVEIFYRSGRMIYNVTLDTQYLREFREVVLIDRPLWNYKTKPVSIRL